jgi:predicted HAD superfamily Cof-like phosphohydrolase
MTIAEMLAEFHRVFVPAEPDPRLIRATLIAEEYGELQEALASGNRLAIAQEAADLVYVAYGTALVWEIDLDKERTQCQVLTTPLERAHRYVQFALQDGLIALLKSGLGHLVEAAYVTARRYGIDLDRAVAEVHRANMSKLGPDGQPVLRADGKVLKGSDYRKPNMNVAL